MSSVENPYPNTAIAIEVDGQRVEGLVTERWERVIEVRLTEPYGWAGLTDAVVTPLFGWAWRVQRGDTLGYLGPGGDHIARQLLSDLYRKATLFEKHAKELLRRWNEMTAKLDAIEGENPKERLRQEKIEVRRRFRAGETSQIEYQQVRKGLRVVQKAFDERREAIESEFWHSPRPWADEHPEIALGGLEEFLRQMPDSLVE